MHKRKMDAMTYVRKHGKPDLFITMTTNPRWHEITYNLMQGQVPQDWPDLLARVFRLKLKKLMDFLKEGIFGEMLPWLYSIEFQKRGLNHIHILVWLVPRVHSDMIDKVISAEIPSSVATHPGVFEAPSIGRVYTVSPRQGEYSAPPPS